MGGMVPQSQIRRTPGGAASVERIVEILATEEFTSRGAPGRRICEEFGVADARGRWQLAGCLKAPGVLAGRSDRLMLPPPRRPPIPSAPHRDTATTRKGGELVMDLKYPDPGRIKGIAPWMASDHGRDLFPTHFGSDGALVPAPGHAPPARESEARSTTVELVRSMEAERLGIRREWLRRQQQAPKSGWSRAARPTENATIRGSPSPYRPFLGSTPDPHLPAGKARRRADMIFDTLRRRWWTAGRRGVARDRKAARSQTRTYGGAVHASGQRPAEISREPARGSCGVRAATGRLRERLASYTYVRRP